MYDYWLYWLRKEIYIFWVMSLINHITFSYVFHSLNNFNKLLMCYWTNYRMQSTCPPFMGAEIIVNLLRMNHCMSLIFWKDLLWFALWINYFSMWVIWNFGRRNSLNTNNKHTRGISGRVKILYQNLSSWDNFSIHNLFTGLISLDRNHPFY